MNADANGRPKLSLIIITYNRPDDMLELAKNIASLQGINEFLAEVVIVNNKSELSYDALEEFIKNTPEVPFSYHVAPTNLGVSKGRNYGVKKSTAPLLVFVDDDAIFETRDVFRNIVNGFSRVSSCAERITGILAFKVFYQSTMQVQQNTFPHKKFQKKKDLHHFEAPYYTGCAHAMMRSVFEKAGYYPENFFYGMEEYDLTYRALNAGFAIFYDDSVVILHKESPGGRITNKEKMRSMWVNKTKVAWKYLPSKYFYSTALLWGIRYLIKSKFDLSGWANGWKEIRNIPANETRLPLTNACIAYLKKMEARLWY